MVPIRRKRPRFRDVLSKQRFDAQQLGDLTGEMKVEELLAFWFFIGRFAAPNVAIIVPSSVCDSRTNVS